MPEPSIPQAPGHAELRHILQSCRSIAVVGLSADWHRPSHFAASYMQGKGYRIVPVNPRYAAAGTAVLGETCYARLEDIPFPVDMVDVFRKTEDVLPATIRKQHVLPSPDKVLRFVEKSGDKDGVLQPSTPAMAWVLRLGVGGMSPSLGEVRAALAARSTPAPAASRPWTPRQE